MNDLVIPNQEKLNSVIEKITSQGTNRLHIIADFDRTLTYSRAAKNEKLKSIVAVLREENYLSPEYSQKAKALFEKYHPIEIDPKIPIEDKKKNMSNWWKEHNRLLIDSGLNKKHLTKIVESGLITLREGAKELFDYTKKNNIPLVIMSASGLGDAIQIILEKENLLSKNIYIITNKFNWDENGNATGFLPQIVHSMNKDETAIKDHPEIYEKIKDRTNVILIGDTLGDLGMITGFNYDNLLKIGFLNPGEEESLPEYEKNFDMIITNDSNLNSLNEILHKIK